VNWLAKFIPPFLRRRRITPIAAFVEPCGIWGVYHTATGKSETRGVMYSATIVAENENGRLVSATEWVAGPDLMRRKEIA
jgi:hypothetical protein